VTLYLDSSSLVKLYVEEPGSDEVHRLVQEADVVSTSAIAYAEVRATFARRRRERLMSPADCSTAIRQFELDWTRFASIPVGMDSALAAGRLADEHGVRALDAVHLSAFKEVLAHADGEVHFSCADERLVKAAKKLG